MAGKKRRWEVCKHCITLMVIFKCSNSNMECWKQSLLLKTIYWKVAELLIFSAILRCKISLIFMVCTYFILRSWSDVLFVSFNLKIVIFYDLMIKHFVRKCFLKTSDYFDHALKYTTYSVQSVYSFMFILALFYQEIYYNCTGFEGHLETIWFYCKA